ncbi:hypothetical protein GCM10009865_06760 [Aeromicrobium ponti]|uniref:Copper binding plastocyanin/azurin family protein n=1 Tax=Cytobacillus oceanisediminis TaxID=665099 RepID=A0A562K7B2_9BACI|nr:cupredoxin domain-containing protein [Cytobacillus oceanisediminis]TWH91124.1 copper binding plastocyanin/azurin family protein [Cytobacillus oceanisediminis]
MGLYQLFVLTTIAASGIAAIMLSIKFRHRLTKMQAMVISMAMGMNMGLTAGVLFGALYQGDLYTSTLVSAGIGVLAGLASGIAFGILPSLEGFMSGLMGGMMGAMLGEMITQEQSLTMLNILLTLSVSSLLLYNILPATKSVDDKKWFLKPFFTFVLLFLFFFFGTQLDKSNAIPYFNSAAIEHSHSSQDKNNKSNEIVLTVNPSEYSYTPEEISLNKGQEASITLNNQDHADHDIEIKKIAIKKKDSGHHANHGVSKADFHLHASSNSSATLTFTPLETGVYEFYCSIPGHKENGMTGTIKVN